MYVVVAVLLIAGDHVPLTELFDVVGNADCELPEQMAATWVNVGVTGLVTVIVVVLEQPKLFRYVITDVPNDLVVTNPSLLIVAMEVFAETQGFVVAAVGEPVS